VPLRLTEAVRDKGMKHLASLSTVAMMSGRVAVMMNESLRGVGEVRGAKKRRGAVGSGGGHFGTLVSLDAVTCAAVALFLPFPPFLVTCAQVCSWGCWGSETV